MPKAITVEGDSGLQLCGPATATIKVGGRTYSFTRGFCAHDLKAKLALQLSLGTDILSFGGAKPDHGRPLFELTLTTSAQQGTLLAVDFGGRKLATDLLIDASFKSGAALTGTFEGKGVSGAWNCHGGMYELRQG